MSTVRLEGLAQERLARARLEPDGLLVVPLPGEGFLAGVVEVCGIPGCVCRDGLLTLFAVDWEVDAVQLDGDRLRLVGPAASLELALRGPLARVPQGPGKGSLLEPFPWAGLRARLEVETGELWLEQLLVEDHWVEVGPLATRGAGDEAEAPDEETIEVQVEGGGAWEGALPVEEVAAGELQAALEDGDAVLEHLEEALDGAMLDALSACVRRRKGDPEQVEEALMDADLEGWEPGDLLCFEQTHSSPRADRYLVRGRLLDVDTLFCPIPDCGCAEVVLPIMDLEAEDDGDVDLGAVRVNLDTEAVRFEAKSDDPELLPHFWARFQRRHHGLTLLRERQSKMRVYGAARGLRFRDEEPGGDHASAPAPSGPRPAPAPSGPRPAPARRETPKVGRNDPCPCGSGKKHKKCCLGKAG